MLRIRIVNLAGGLKSANGEVLSLESPDLLSVSGFLLVLGGLLGDFTPVSALQEVQVVVNTCLSVLLLFSVNADAGSVSKTYFSINAVVTISSKIANYQNRQKGFCWSGCKGRC